MTSALQPLIGTAADRPLTRAEAELAFEAVQWRGHPKPNWRFFDGAAYTR